MYRLESLIRIPRLDNEYDFDIAPDGSSIVFSWNKTGRWELYERQLSASSGESASFSDPRLLTENSGGSFAAVSSPDGTRLAYAMDVDGSENYHLLIFDRSTGRTRDLTPDVRFTLQPNFSWSPNGDQIALVADKDGCFDVYLISTADDFEGLKKVFGNGHPCWLAKWSPDGNCLAIDFECHISDRSIALVNLTTGETHQLGDGFSAKEPHWSPDGKSLAFCSDKDGFYKIGMYQIPDGQIRWLVGDVRTNYETPAFSPDGRQVVGTRQRGALTDLVVWSENGIQVHAIGNGLHSHPRFSPDGDSIFCVFENAACPPDLWQIDLGTCFANRITHSLPPEMRDTNFVEPEEITYPGMDGVPVPAMLYRTGHTDGPAVVCIHGGPTWYYSNFWYAFIAHCTSRGWTVLAPNYRGSSGYGRDWQNAARFDYGGVDTRDVAAGAQWLIEQGLADPERIAVTGASHGGYLTMTCLTQFPELWAAGSAVVPFLNWFTAHEASRRDLQHWDFENMGDPHQREGLWRERSPFFFLDQIRAPVQLMCGANDPRCPASESIAARDKLVELGKPVELILYEGEGHGFLKIETVLDSERKRVEFLARALET